MLQKAARSVWRRCVNGSISLCVLYQMVILSEYFSVELGATRVLINFLQMINECFLISIPALEKRFTYIHVQQAIITGYTTKSKTISFFFH